VNNSGLIESSRIKSDHFVTNKQTKLQRRKRVLEEGEYRQRCYVCYRPQDRCFCDSIPKINNQTEVLILQHRRERNHPFNTARIVRQALQRCELIVERNEHFSDLELPVKPGAGLLYPGPESKLLSDLTPGERPQQLVVLDGTWHHAKTLFRDIPQIKELPRYRLAPSKPGQYRIRLEPTATSLSTLEATVAALKQIDSNVNDLDRLLVAFNTMIEQQLAHPKANYSGIAAANRKPKLNVPQSLKRDLNRIVVAYGESTPVAYDTDEGWSSLNRKKKEAAKMPPVQWVAQRLGDRNDTFDCTIQSPCANLSQRILNHMELTQADFAKAVSLEEFRIRWRHFLNDDDLLVVQHQHSIRLLQQAEAMVPAYETIKSINHDPQREFRSLTAFLESKSVPIGRSLHSGRAGERLARVASLVRYLNQLP
jgi:DTW domain-containing protein YfiP